jgi:uncharacterized cupin superfamily protein
MIVHIRGADVALEQVEKKNGEKQTGMSAWGNLWVHPDGVLETGLWEFQGEEEQAAIDGYEEVVVMLEGSLHITCEGQEYTLTPGDLFIMDCPVGPMTFRSDGAKSAFVVRRRPS